MRVLGLDVGEKHIGLAVSDGLGWTAQGLSTVIVQDKNSAISSIIKVIKENEVSEVVVGMPFNMDGSPGKKAQEIANFIEDLKKKIPLPIKIWDERLSSVEAEKLMLQADLSRRKRKRKVDKLAAQLILQGYLDAKNVQKEHS